MDDLTRTIGPYKIVSELGRGGMGVVYKAWEERLDRHVAIKMLADQYCKDDKVVARFMREARAVASVHHPNIVQVFSVDEYQGQPYIVMEYVEGESLGDYIQRERKLSPHLAVSMLREAASGLAAAHARGVVHRDVKPANLMLSKGGGVKVVDFGIARVENADANLTATGMAMGTPAYLSPEVCLAKSVDQRSDIFSLGVVLYEMLTGKTPFSASSPLELMSKVVEARIPDLIELDGEIDQALYQVLKLMLASDPEHRYPDCRQLIADLDDYLSGQAPCYAGAKFAGGSPAIDQGGEATVAWATPPEGVLHKKGQATPTGTASVAPTAAAAAGKSANRRMFVFAALIGLVLLVTVSAASWQLMQHFSVPLPGLSQSASSSVDGVAEQPVPSPVEPEASTDSPVETKTSDFMEPIEPESSGKEIEQPDELKQQVARVAVIAQSDVVDPAQAPAMDEDAGAATGLDPADKAVYGDAAAQLDAPTLVQVEKKPAAAAEVHAPVGTGDKDAPDSPASVAEGRTLAAVEPPLAGASSSPTLAPPAVSASIPDRPVEPAAVVRGSTWDRANPRLAVVVSGDRLSAVPLRASLERLLADAGYRLLDPDLLDLQAGAGLGSFSRELRGGGADVMVFVEIEPAGETELSFYGRYDTLYTVNVSLRTVQLHDNEPLAPLWQDSMRYTALSAEEKAREMASPLLEEVVRSLARL